MGCTPAHPTQNSQRPFLGKPEPLLSCGLRYIWHISLAPKAHDQHISVSKLSGGWHLCPRLRSLPWLYSFTEGLRPYWHVLSQRQNKRVDMKRTLKNVTQQNGSCMGSLNLLALGGHCLLRLKWLPQEIPDSDLFMRRSNLALSLTLVLSLRKPTIFLSLLWQELLAKENHVNPRWKAKETAGT